MQSTIAQPIWKMLPNLVKDVNTLFVKQFVDPSLGNSSYLIASKETGIAAVIDPQRDVQKYLQAATELGLSLMYALETHLHSDFISGSLELADALGQSSPFQIGASARAGLEYKYTPLAEGDRLSLGDIFIEVIETPGHTPEHISYAVYQQGSNVPRALFSGGSLIVGGVGRTDLLGDDHTEALAHAQFHSLHDKLLKLPDEVIVYPTHGGGSFCTTTASKERVTSIRQERKNNPMTQIRAEKEFVKRAQQNLSTYPTYYQYLRRVNQGFRRILPELPAFSPLTPASVRQQVEQGAVIVDIRPARDFNAGHIPNSYGIPLATPLGTWAGWVVPFGSPIILLADSPEEREEATRQLIRIGYDDIRGYLDGGLEAWEKADLPVSTWRLISPSRLLEWLHRKTDSPLLLDVRQRNEWVQSHIYGARHIEAGSLVNAIDTLPPKDQPIVVHCARGNRSTIALSILEQKGFRNLFALEDGFSSWYAAGYEIIHGGK